MKPFVKTLVAVFTSIGLALAVLNPAMAAGTATFSLTPSASTVNIGNTFSVSIFENGTEVNVVTANLTYDATKLEFVSINTSGSAFPNTVNGTGGGGSVNISRYTAPGTTVSGSKKVAAVNFKAKVGSGTTSIAMASSSKIASNGSDIWNHAPTSTAVNLATPAPAPTQPTPQEPAPVPNQPSGDDSKPVQDAPKATSDPETTETPNKDVAGAEDSTNKNTESEQPEVVAPTNPNNDSTPQSGNYLPLAIAAGVAVLLGTFYLIGRHLATVPTVAAAGKKSTKDKVAANKTKKTTKK